MQYLYQNNQIVKKYAIATITLLASLGALCNMQLQKEIYKKQPSYEKNVWPKSQGEIIKVVTKRWLWQKIF